MKKMEAAASFFLLLLACVAEVVRAELGMSIEQSPVRKAQGDTFFIICEAKKGHVGEGLTWHFPNGTAIRATEYSNSRIYVEQENDDDCRGCVLLFFTSIRLSDQGQYKCSGRVDGAARSKTFQLKVFRDIKFEDAPTSQNFTEFTDAPVMCVVSGEPKPIVEWKYNSRKLSNDKKYRITNNGITIRNISRSKDVGVYTCRARVTDLKEEQSNVKIRNIRVQVFFAPRFEVDELESKFAWFQSKVNLTCQADGLPLPLLRWFRHGKKIRDKDGEKIYGHTGTSILEVAVNNEQDFGTYVCKASNGHGAKAEQKVQLRQAFPPGVPVDIGTKSRAHDHVTLSIMPPLEKSDLDLISYTVEIRQKAGSQPQEWREAMSKQFAVRGPFKLDGLIADTEYEYRVTARNAAGPGNASEPITVKTLGISTAGHHNGNAVTFRENFMTTSIISIVFAFLCKIF